MPPKKRATPSTAPKKSRASKLARENDISAEEENEIKEAFHLFSAPHDDFPDEKEGVIPQEDVRKALVPQELQSILSALDPTSTGLVPYAPFLAVAAAKLHSRSDDANAAEDQLGEDLLRDMILEANGGEGVQAGVTLEEFRDVMTRAGVF
ncbi:hypothetical protein P168DRAFT_300230 [Aspergillus campestris IBT 28561]|uniref:EF-hand superfamily Ca2+-modulated protein n=1 Tax=Aspergillus campestris (strain IBT 28561) TaxID=1392248 RepID=A0A2I1CR22_ASPC2|nr:uncharacterized protein P168DRAFT_300230 [Aspergillus campestris IBT 28561]PKY00081.1 hypothetical protein P168DRAFT_300230 [Aspergillus campestris IBT 28561]